MYSLRFTLVAAVALLAGDVASWSFRPVLEPLSPSPLDIADLLVLCQADTPLASCSVNVFADGHSYPAVDLGQGSRSRPARVEHHRGNWTAFETTYAGEGLERGHCGAVFREMYFVIYMVGCGGADAAGEYHQLELSVVHPREAIQPSSVNPRQTVVERASAVSVLMQAALPLQMCAVTLPNKPSDSIIFFSGTDFPHSDHYRYHGRGLQHGECGVTLENVTEEDNGPVFLMALTTDGKTAQQVSTIIVSAIPYEIGLTVDKTSYSTGDILNARCHSLESRPAGKFTWTLDSKIIPQNPWREDSRIGEWKWSWEKQSVAQNITRRLEEGDFGKVLGCQVEHKGFASNGGRARYVIVKS